MTPKKNREPQRLSFEERYDDLLSSARSRFRLLRKTTLGGPEDLVVSALRTFLRRNADKVTWEDGHLTSVSFAEDEMWTILKKLVWQKGDDTRKDANYLDAVRLPQDGQENIHRLWNGLSSDDATESIFPFLASVLDEEIQSLETEDDRLVALLLLQGATIQGIADSMDRSFSTARIMRTRVLETLRMRLMQKLDQRD